MKQIYQKTEYINNNDIDIAVIDNIYQDGYKAGTV